jgi:hypothetical protein
MTCLVIVFTILSQEPAVSSCSHFLLSCEYPKGSQR